MPFCHLPLSIFLSVISLLLSSCLFYFVADCGLIFGMGSALMEEDEGGMNSQPRQGEFFFFFGFSLVTSLSLFGWGGRATPLKEFMKLAWKLFGQLFIVNLEESSNTHGGLGILEIPSSIVNSFPFPSIFIILSLYYTYIHPLAIQKIY
jgi:hypothetical protein